MSLQPYDLVTLLDVLYVFKTPTPFWLNFFPAQINFVTEKIAFDRVNADYRRLAPFVAPNVQGRIMTTEGYDTVEFKPAYVKPKHVIDPDIILVRRPGEALSTGTLNPAQRRDAVIADILYRHAQMHIMTREWMAARAIIDGKVTIQGDDYPAVTVDFRRDASLTVILTGAAQWNNAATANPLGDIAAIRNQVRVLTGSVVRDIVFGRDAWSNLIARQDIKDLMNNFYRGSETTLSKVIDNFEDNSEFLGELKGSEGNGTLRFWLYSGKFRDHAGVLQDILDPGMIVGISPDVQGIRCFGAIKDRGAQYQALDMFPKMWEEEDPSVEFLMTQSAPLMVPKQPNATFSIQVLTPEVGGPESGVTIY